MSLSELLREGSADRKEVFCKNCVNPEAGQEKYRKNCGKNGEEVILRETVLCLERRAEKC